MANKAEGRWVPENIDSITSDDVVKLIDSLAKDSQSYWEAKIPSYRTKAFDSPAYWFEKISDREDRMDEQTQKRHDQQMRQPITRGEFLKITDEFQKHMNGAINGLEARVGDVVGAIRDAVSSGTSRREVVIRALIVKNLITQEEIDEANAEMDEWGVKVEELLNPNLPWEDKLVLIEDWNDTPGNMEIHARDLGFDNYLTKNDGKLLPYEEKVSLSKRAKMPEEFFKLLEATEKVRLEEEKSDKEEREKQNERS